nr:unnamed protein product [Haemonchus contortus]
MLPTHSFLPIRSSAYSALEEHTAEVEGINMVLTVTGIDMDTGHTMDTDRMSIVHMDMDGIEMDPTAIMDKSFIVFSIATVLTT